MTTAGSATCDGTTELLEAAFRAGVAAADPAAAIRRRLPAPPAGRLLLVAVGKAALSMAREAHGHYDSLGVAVTGLVITPAGTAAVLPGLKLLEAGHPHPTRASQLAGEAVLDLLADATQDDLLLCLISGGASTLMVAPAGVTLEQFVRVNSELLASGAGITEINSVRRKLCRLKGGGLAVAAAPARVVALVLSDVVGDDLAVIASGPTVADPDEPSDALAVLDRYSINDPAVIRQLARQQRDWRAAEVSADTRIVGSGSLSLQAAARELEVVGWPVRLLSEAVTGPAGEAAAWHAEEVRKVLRMGKRCALLSGGETTVRLPAAAGHGGRNSHFVVALAAHLWGAAGIRALSADTDGIDGNSAAAGGQLTPALFASASRSEAHAALDSASTGDFLEKYGHAFLTGRTGTNVNDLRIMLVEG